MFIGLVIVVIGLAFLLQNLGIVSGDLWAIIWPCLIIVLGLSIVIKKKAMWD
jgi:hypothetical protein